MVSDGETIGNPARIVQHQQQKDGEDKSDEIPYFGLISTHLCDYSHPISVSICPHSHVRGQCR